MRSLIVLSLAVLACDSPANNPNGDVCTTPGFLCATPACYQFPTQGDCDYVSPSNAYCPLDRNHCFDPSTVAGYCNPQTAICAGPKDGGGSCAPTLCTVDDVKRCYDTNDRVFCKNAFRCVNFGCADGGTDGGGDGGPSDMSAPSDAAISDLSAINNG